MSKLSTAKRFPFTTSSDRLQNGYAAVEIQEGFNQLCSLIYELSQEIVLLKSQVSELLIRELHEMSKDHLTIADVEKLYDISKRTQQEERSNEKLGHIKKEDGKKILYKLEHIHQYLNEHYLELKPKTES